MKVGIIGCGVSGLTCGIRLLEHGFNVHIMARELSPNTTSDVAAAFWFPSRVNPKDRALRWGKNSYQEFKRLCGISGSGVFETSMIQYFDGSEEEPWWKDIVEEFARLGSEELFGIWVSGRRFQVFLIESRLYMPYLSKRFVSLGGTIERRDVSNLSDLIGGYSLLINCSGVWARELLGDHEVYPVRGQVIRAKKPKNLGRSILDRGGEAILAFIVPRSSDCILGGTCENHDWSLEPREEAARGIIERCRQLYPELGEPEILEHKVGLRPGRSKVRLELEKLSSSCAVIHNYGHGGAGYTLSWGCADEVLSLALEYKN